MRTLAFIALLLAGMFLHAQTGCSDRYRTVADELDLAKSTLTANDALYDTMSQLHGMVLMKATVAAYAVHCTPPELLQLDRIEAALSRKGFASTAAQIEERHRAKQRQEWEQALQQFSVNIEMLVNSK